MGIKKLVLKNFKAFRENTFVFNDSVNIIVGNNETGKTTLLEAIHLALSGYYLGKNVRNDFSQFLFNRDCVNEYITSVKQGKPLPLPELKIEVFMNDSFPADFQGDENSDKDDNAKGFTFKISFNELYKKEYEELLHSKTDMGFPIEYYDASWESFARDGNLTPRKIPMKSSFIDSAGNYGRDFFTPKMIQEKFEAEDAIKVSQAFRKMVNTFSSEISEINEKYSSEAVLSGKSIKLSVSNDNKFDWENKLISEVDDIPFPHVGKGMQCLVKTSLSLQHKKTQNSDVLLIEEPESHLSFSWLNKLVKMISSSCLEKQIFISTHSSFVANKLGLENLTLLSNGKSVLFKTYTEQSSFFRKVAGYDTLRFILCDKAILVEGASDELIVKRAYMDTHNGHEPIQDGIDVISVGLSFLRFLQIAKDLKIKVSVVTDNDGDVAAIKNKYLDYLGKDDAEIKICFDSTVDDLSIEDLNSNTLEPKLVKANKNNIGLFNNIFGTKFNDILGLLKYMHNNKTECALRIFESDKNIVFPKYITDSFQYE